MLTETFVGFDKGDLHACFFNMYSIYISMYNPQRFGKDNCVRFIYIFRLLALEAEIKYAHGCSANNQSTAGRTRPSFFRGRNNALHLIDS